LSTLRTILSQGERCRHRLGRPLGTLSLSAAVIEIRVAEPRQLFNAIDPSPFRQRDLDPRAEEFIVDWASDLPMDRAFLRSAIRH
jgi:hypothetical protein